MLGWPCILLVTAVIVYFICVDRKLRRLDTTVSLLTEQLKKWGFVPPK